MGPHAKYAVVGANLERASLKSRSPMRASLKVACQLQFHAAEAPLQIGNAESTRSIGPRPDRTRNRPRKTGLW